MSASALPSPPSVFYLSGHEVFPQCQPAATAVRLLGRGQPERARDLLVRSLARESTPDLRLAYAGFLIRVERFAEAAGILADLLASAEESRDFVRLALIARKLAAIYRARGDFPSAAAFQRYAARITPRTGSARASLAGEAAVDAILAGKPATAERLLWRTILYRVAGENPAEAAADWGNLGLLALQHGRLGAAVRYLRLSWQGHCTLRDAAGAARNLLHFGLIAACRGRRRTACRRLRRAERIFRRIEQGSLAQLAREYRSRIAEERRQERVPG